MFKKLFQKSVTEYKNPILGTVIPLEEVPDQVFSQKMVGDGFAIIPSDGKVYAPVNGEIIQIFPTKHAIGILDENGIEVLIHFGIDTVELKGENFEAFIQKGDKITVGQLLLEVDINFVIGKGKSIVTPIVFTNKSQYKSIEIHTGEKAVGDVVCTLK